MDARIGNELRQQRCREPNRGPGRAFHHHLSDAAPVIVQIFLHRDVDAEFESFHVGTRCKDDGLAELLGLDESSNASCARQPAGID